MIKEIEEITTVGNLKVKSSVKLINRLSTKSSSPDVQYIADMERYNNNVKKSYVAPFK